MTKRRKLLVWAGVLSGIVCLLFGYTAYALINNVDGMLAQVKDLFLQLEIPEKDITNLLNDLCDNLIIYAIADGVACAVYIASNFLSAKNFGKVRYIPALVGCVNFILGASVISSILAIISAFVKEEQNPENRKQEFMQAQYPDLTPEQMRQGVKLSAMAEKIAMIKTLKQEGSISEEEYKRLLNEIITLGSRE